MSSLLETPDSTFTEKVSFVQASNTMKLVSLFQFVFSYNCVNSIKIDGFEFQDNTATTHITEDNGIASINFWV